MNSAQKMTPEEGTNSFWYTAQANHYLLLGSSLMNSSAESQPEAGAFNRNVASH